MSVQFDPFRWKQEVSFIVLLNTSCPEDSIESLALEKLSNVFFKSI